MARYATLSPEFRRQLEKIKPSVDRALHYYPCAARLLNDDILACVYVVCDAPYIKLWGVYPEDDPGKNWVRIQDVAEIVESPFRLPAKCATKLYRSSESGMGYTIFTVVFSDGSKQAYRAGNAVDFVKYPHGKSSKDVVKALPHEGRQAEMLATPRYFWCLYSEE